MSTHLPVGDSWSSILCAVVCRCAVRLQQSHISVDVIGTRFDARSKSLC